MENSRKTFLPPPNFTKKVNEPPKLQSHYLTPSGMTLLPRNRQPPPMYGPRGATIPAKFLQKDEPSEKKVDRQFCIECEMQLEPDEDLPSHRLEHTPCPINDCNYRGHPTIMDKHIAALHASGLFEKIKKLNTPEEIAAWREERRKRYPSVANVLLQQKAREQRQQRGERLEPNKSRFGKPEERRRFAAPYTVPKSGVLDNKESQKRSDGDRKRPLKYKAREKGKRAAKRERAVAHKTPDESLAAEGSVAEQAIDFKGTSKLKDYQHMRPKKKLQSNALSSLLGMYGSSNEEDSESETQAQDSHSGTETEDANIHKKSINGNVHAKQQPKDSHDFGQSQTEATKLCVDDSRPCTKVGARAQPANTETYTTSMFLSNDPKAGELASKTSEPFDLGVGQTTVKYFAKDSDVPQLQCGSKGDELTRPLETKENANTSCDEAPEEAAVIHISDVPTPAPKFNPLQRIALQVQCDSVKDELSRPLETKENANASSDEAPEEAAIQHISDVPTPGPKFNPLPATPQCSNGRQIPRKIAKERFKRKLGLDYRKAKLRKPHSMLERLLEPDIRHERNVLLQCVRYVVANNFFDVANPKNKKAAENAKDD